MQLRFKMKINIFRRRTHTKNWVATFPDLYDGSFHNKELIITYPDLNEFLEELKKFLLRIYGDDLK